MGIFSKMKENRIAKEVEESTIKEVTKAPAKVTKILKAIILALAVILCVFHLYTGITLPMQPMNQRTIHLGIALILVYLYDALERKNIIMRIFDYIMALCGAVACIYIFFNWADIAGRAAFLNGIDITIGVLILVGVIIATYKMVGIWMPAIAVIFILYCWLGQHLPGAFGIPRISISRFIGYMTMGTEGIFGTCLGTSATFAFLFILYAEFLIQLGAGDFVINLAQSVLGHVRGGPAKIAVVASGLFGSISGNAVANVAGTGCLTIPLMKKMGFKSEFAGGVESAASTGGALMPPVMGAVAFIMADLLSIPYSSICWAALVPALLYYIGIFMMVDLESVKVNLKGLPKEELPRTRDVLKDGWHYLFSFGTLIVLLMVFQWSTSKAAIWAMIALIIAVYVKKIIKKEKIDLKMFLDIFNHAGKSILTVACATACAGIIVGAFMITGLSLRFSTLLVTLAGGSLPILLVLAMVAAIILGMGLPVTPVYIILSVLVAPAITAMGVSPMAANLFILYFGVMACITPPVGLAFYVASGIAESNPMKTGFMAWKLALPGFILPFVFVYNPGLLLMDSFGACLQVVATSLIGVLSLAFCLEGYCMRKSSIIIRVLFGISALLSIIPETFTDIVGVALFIVLVAVEFLAARKLKKQGQAIA